MPLAETWFSQEASCHVSVENSGKNASPSTSKPTSVKTQIRGNRQGFVHKLRAAHDDDFQPLTQSQRIFQRGRRLRAFGPIILAGDDDILTAGQRFARQRLPCFAAHNDGFAVSEGFEKAKISGKMPRHGVVDADTAAGGIGGDKGAILGIMKSVCKIE